jgi:hypothetical protein
MLPLPSTTSHTVGVTGAVVLMPRAQLLAAPAGLVLDALDGGIKPVGDGL